MQFTRLDRIIQIACLVNFAAYMLVTVLIGGDAINGHEMDGHYFLASHGKLTEVSRGLFIFSEVHSVAVWVLFALAFMTLLRARWRGRRGRQS